MVHFFGQSPKNEPHSPLRASEASAKTSSLDFMYGFKFCFERPLSINA
ncbi:MAG: hypothetical protein U5L45_05005 [Saprospiraceae bacterium]|nr:hypothetical protein [Saprospiraceae bacterium]